MRLNVRRFLAGAIVIAALMGLAGFLLHDSAPMPSFHFLSNHKPIRCDTRESRRAPDRTTEFCYVFEADFNDICREAEAELSALGFLDQRLPPPNDAGIRLYNLWNEPREELIMVTILDEFRAQGLLESTASFIDKQLQEKYRNGWVYVSVIQRRHKPDTWRTLLSRTRRQSRKTHALLRKAPSADDLKRALNLSYDVYPSVGMHPVRFGMSKEEAISAIGEPENVDNRDVRLVYDSMGFSIMLSEQKGVQQFNFYTRRAAPAYVYVKDFEGKTKQGISMGSSRSRILDAYGPANSEHEIGFQKWMVYNRQGLAFILLNDELIQFLMFAPEPDEAVPVPSKAADPRQLFLLFDNY